MAIVIAQLKELKNEFYSTGNVDYAGRYMFTGYRTDTPLTFTENLSENPADPSYRNFEITEQLDVSAFDTINYTNIGDLKGVTKDNYDPVNDGVKEEEADITNSNIHRIRLSYDAIKADNTNKPTITMISEADKQAAAVNGTKPQETTLIAQGDIEVVSSTAVPNPYDYVLANPGKAVLIPETGELLIGEDLYNNNPSLSNMDAGTEMRITYQKDSWKKAICSRSIISRVKM